MGSPRAGLPEDPRGLRPSGLTSPAAGDLLVDGLQDRHVVRRLQRDRRVLDAPPGRRRGVLPLLRALGRETREVVEPLAHLRLAVRLDLGRELLDETPD